jgi:hypothetical protein
MKAFFLLKLFIAACIYANAQQDTVIIKNIKYYQKGKVNILRSPSGKRTVVQLENSATWKQNEKIDSLMYWDKEKRTLKPGIDTSSRMPSPLPLVALAISGIDMNFLPFKSYVDPSLTTAQKQAIQANGCVNPKFAGLSRGKVKTSIVSGNSYAYTSLLPFLHTLPPDVDMEDVIDALNAPWKERAIQELKNVTLTNIYLKAYKREDDNDYHLILCNSTQTVFFNAEISGLPGNSSASYQTLKNVRNVFNTYPGSPSCGSSYVKFTNPVKIVKLKGSLFFDTDHAAGSVGPSGFRPNTAWEIHPITYIEFQ